MCRQIGFCEASEPFWFITEETEQSITWGSQGLCHFQCGGLLTSEENINLTEDKVPQPQNLKYFIIKLKLNWNSRNSHWAVSCKNPTTHLSTLSLHDRLGATKERQTNPQSLLTMLAIIVNSCIPIQMQEYNTSLGQNPQWWKCVSWFQCFS